MNKSLHTQHTARSNFLSIAYLSPSRYLYCTVVITFQLSQIRAHSSWMNESFQSLIILDTFKGPLWFGKIRNTTLSYNLAGVFAVWGIFAMLRNAKLPNSTTHLFTLNLACRTMRGFTSN